MKKLIGIMALMFVLLTFSSVKATITDITAEATTSRATTGTNVVVTVSVTASQSETTDLRLITSPSGITISDPPTGYYSSVSVSTSPTTKTFTITAGVEGTYTYYAQAGTTQSTAKTIVFVSPSSLTVSGSPTSVTKYVGQGFTLTITITNPQANAITTSYSLNLPSGWTASGDKTSDTITMNPGTTTTLRWTITVSTSGSKTITFQLGNNVNAFSVSVTGISTTTTTAGGGAGVAGIGVPGVGKIRVSKLWLEILPGKVEMWKITEPGIGLVEFRLQVRNKVNNVKITISRLDRKPTTIVHEVEGKVYQYIEINKTNLVDDDIEKVKIKFKVNKTWITENRIDKTTVSLYRYENGWEKLPTQLIDEDDEYVYYEAETNKLSIFAIAGKVVEVTTTTLATTTTLPTETTTTTTLPTGYKPTITRNLWIIVIAVAVIIFLFVFVKRVK